MPSCLTCSHFSLFFLADSAPASRPSYSLNTTVRLYFILGPHHPPSILLVSVQMLPSFTICVQFHWSLLLWDCFLPTATFLLRQGLVKPRLVCNHTAKAGLDTSSSFNCYPLENTANFLFASWLLGFPIGISAARRQILACASVLGQTPRTTTKELGVVVRP